MGLDVVEFIMAVEEEFGLSIPDVEASEILTPGQLVDFLAARLPTAGEPTCGEQRAFYALRRVGIRVLKQPRTAFRAASAWRDLLPARGHRHVWRVMQRAVSVSNWPVMPLSGEGPWHQKTVGDTARWLAEDFRAAWQQDRWNRHDIETVVRKLMAVELGVLTFDWDSQFVRDLGCG